MIVAQIFQLFRFLSIPSMLSDQMCMNSADIYSNQNGIEAEDFIYV